MILSRLLELTRGHNPLGLAAWPLFADLLGQNEFLGTATIFIQFVALAVTYLQLQLRLRTINQRDKLLFAFRPFGRLPWPLILFARRVAQNEAKTWAFFGCEGKIAIAVINENKELSLYRTYNSTIPCGYQQKGAGETREAMGARGKRNLGSYSFVCQNGSKN